MIHFITGGSRGIGAGLVLEAAGRGHDVAFTYLGADDAARRVLNEARTRRGEGRVTCHRLDVRDVQEVERVVEAVIEEHGGIDVVVNNAGVTRDGLLASMSEDDWHEVIATNLTGPFYVCRQVLPTMMAQRFGRIINISSISAGGASGQANYAASKSGLHGLTQTIAKEYGRKGITANVVVPGFFETDMTRASLSEGLRGFWKSYCPVPKGRTGEIEELAAVVLFLASREAGFVNGQILPVTGGLDWGP